MSEVIYFPRRDIMDTRKWLNGSTQAFTTKKLRVQTNYTLPLYSYHVPAGFPSPADDYIEGSLDLNEHLIQHPSATFCVRVSGNSMKKVGIFDGNLLLVDRSLKPIHQDIVIAVVNGETTVKRLHLKNGQMMLIPENDDYEPIIVKEGSEVEIWGVVISCINELRKTR